MSRIYYSTVLLLFEFPPKTCTYPLGKLITEFTGPRLSVSYFLYTLYEVEELLGQLLEAAAPMACRNSFPQAGVGSIKSEPDSMWEGVPSTSGLFKTLDSAIHCINHYPVDKYYTNCTIHWIVLSTFLNNWGQVFCCVKLESNKDVALQDRRTSELNSLFKQVDERRKVS